MRKILLFGILLFGNIMLFAPAPYEIRLFVFEPITYQDLIINAIGQIESGNNDFAINEKEGAYGRYQIRSIKLQWYAKKTGVFYTLEDCYDKTISKSILLYHLSQYDNMDKAIMAWNGSGPMAEKYLQKVKKYLN